MGLREYPFFGYRQGCCIPDCNKGKQFPSIFLEFYIFLVLGHNKSKVIEPILTNKTKGKCSFGSVTDATLKSKNSMPHVGSM